MNRPCEQTNIFHFLSINFSYQFPFPLFDTSHHKRLTELHICTIAVPKTDNTVTLEIWYYCMGIITLNYQHKHGRSLNLRLSLIKAYKSMMHRFMNCKILKTTALLDSSTPTSPQYPAVLSKGGGALESSAIQAGNEHVTVWGHALWIQLHCSDAGTQLAGFAAMYFSSARCRPV